MISIYPYTDAWFESKYPVSESVSRLSARVKNVRWPFFLAWPLWEGGVLGTVEPGKVILRHWKPWRYFTGRIRFKGSFTEKNDSTVLSGRFEFPKYDRVFMTLWFVATIVLFLFPFILNMSESSRVGFFAVPALMLFLWIVSVLWSWRCWHWGKMEIEYISQTIKDVFS